MPNYYLPTGYQHRTTPEFDNHEVLDRQDGIWQPEIYRIAGKLAITRIVDIGCGRCLKLKQYHDKFEIVGFETPDNVQWCQENLPFGMYFCIDLERKPDLDKLDLIKPDDVVILADVIEHLINPSYLLKKLAELEYRYLIISTPDREKYWPNHLGPPHNPCHVREWSLPEFRKLMDAYGIPVQWAGHTQSVTTSSTENTITIIAGKNPYTHEGTS